jgi:hypothetical protein
MDGSRRSNDMTRKTPFFIAAALVFAALTLTRPDLELEAAAEEPVKGATIHAIAGAPQASSAKESKP